MARSDAVLNSNSLFLVLKTQVAVDIPNNGLFSNVIQHSDSQKLIPIPAASVLPGNLPERQIPGPYSSHTE